MTTINPMSALGTTAIVMPSALNDGWTYVASAGHYKTADLYAALNAVPAEDAERDERVIAWESIVKHEVFRSCYDEERPLLHAMLDRLDALKAVSAERDALAKTVERVRAVVTRFLDPHGQDAVVAARVAEKIRAALDPEPAFVLPTEAGVRFEAINKNSRKRYVFTTLTGLKVPVYALDGDPDYVYVEGALVAHYEDFRLIGGEA